MRERPLHLCFPAYEANRPTIPLAAALGIGSPIESIVGTDRFSALYQIAPRLWTVTSLTDADIVIDPHEYRPGQRVQTIAREARSERLPCVFFKPDEELAPTHLDYGSLYRYSVYKSLKRCHERVMPALCNDIVAELTNGWSPSTYTDRPSVGFCGYVGGPIRRFLFRVLGRREKVRGLSLRVDILNTLRQNSQISTDFICRTNVWGGANRRLPFLKTSREAVRRQYISNLSSNPYTLCVRGKGNYSFRFYETLSAGRIPILIDTDRVLPFSNYIDWTEHILRIDIANVEHLGERVITLHQKLDSRDLCAVQRANRRLWGRWLSPVGFFERAIRREVFGLRSTNNVSR